MWEVPGGINDGWLRDWGPTVSTPVGCCLADFREGTQSAGLAAWRGATLSEDAACGVVCCCCAVWAVSFQSWPAAVAHREVLPRLRLCCALCAVKPKAAWDFQFHCVAMNGLLRRSAAVSLRTAAWIAQGLGFGVGCQMAVSISWPTSGQAAAEAYPLGRACHSFTCKLSDIVVLLGSKQGFF